MIGQVHIKSSGIENSISAITAADRRENCGLKEGGDFLSILKSSAEFRDNPVLKRDENINKSSSEDKSSEPGRTENGQLIREPFQDTRPEYEKSHIRETADTGSSLKSHTERTEKNDTGKKSSGSREDSKESRGDTDSILAAAGESLVGKNSSLRLHADGKTAGEKFSAPQKKHTVKTAGMIRNADEHKSLQKDENAFNQKGRLIQSGISELLEKSSKSVWKNGSIKKGAAQEHSGLKESRENTAPLSGSIIKDKAREDRSANTRKNKEVEAAAGDKKNESSEVVNPGRKMNADGSGSGRGAGSGSDNSRDNSQVYSGKIETASRHTSERTENANKMPEFRQSLQEIMDRAKVTVSDSRNGSFTVKLFPKELGSVNVNLIMENGVVNGRFLVDNNDAKTMLLSSIENLMDELRQSGVSVGEFSVNVRDGGERFVRDRDEYRYKTGPLPGGSKEAVTAADVYDYNSIYKHNGSINMII